MTGKEPILRLDGVAKTYTDTPDGTVALEDVSMSVRPGEFVSVVGQSGAGKSTLLRIAADLTEPTSGRVSVCGRTPREARRNRDFGIVFQSPVLYDWRTVMQNVQLPLEIAGMPAAERRERAEETLGLVGLSDCRDLRPHQLSGGMQRRVAIARAMVVRPRLLLLDEPFAALDELARERLSFELLRLWHETGVTVLFVSHLIGESVLLADRVVVLSPRPGRVLTEIPVELPRPRGVETRTSPEFHAQVDLVRAALRAQAK
ncbi:MAG: ABC transporter ATP-binding protein [Anaerolineae bacterium]|jgi:NitT/TauT family transport system ATP-binding protein